MAQVVIVTGLAGAGRGTALGALEDSGFEAVDNLPVGMLRAVVTGRDRDPQPLAIGIDSRARHFAPERIVALIGELRADPGVHLSVLFLDCDDEVLIQRFTETRRRHPLADLPVAAAIAREREVMAGIRAIADVHLDTSRNSVQDLRRVVMRRFAPDLSGRLRVEVMSFSYRVGVPREADLVLDVRFLSNPHWQRELRPLTGLVGEVQAYIRADARLQPFVDRLFGLLELLLPAYRDEGKSYLTIAFGCTGGKHRSVYLAELLAAHLAAGGWDVTVRHREQGLERPVPAPLDTAVEPVS